MRPSTTHVRTIGNSMRLSHEGCLFKFASSWDTSSNLPSVLGDTLSWTRGAAYSPLEPRGRRRNHAGSPAAGGIPTPALLVLGVPSFLGACRFPEIYAAKRTRRGSYVVCSRNR